MEKIKISKILLIISLALFWAGICQAGFGVSPPWVKSEYLLQGSHFEQTIYLVQSEPKEDYRAEVEFSSEALKIKDWIKIDRGMNFTIPAGVQKFPLKITVDVPQDAELGKYKGYIWISGKPKKEEGAHITTVMGATIELTLKVTDKEFSDWRLRDWGINSLEKDEKTIKVYLEVENLGNVKTRPSRVHLDVYDDYHREILGRGDNTDLEYVLPFQTKKIIAEFPINLEVKKQYWGEVEIYKEGKIFLTDKRRFDVGEIGERKEAAQEEERADELSGSATATALASLIAGLNLGFLGSKAFLFTLLGLVLLVGLGFIIKQVKKSRLKSKVKLKRRRKEQLKIK